VRGGFGGSSLLSSVLRFPWCWIRWCPRRQSFVRLVSYCSSFDVLLISSVVRRLSSACDLFKKPGEKMVNKPSDTTVSSRHLRLIRTTMSRCLEVLYASDP
jgi:hypothetical protein